MNLPEILGWSVIGIVIAQLVVSVSFLVWINLTAFVHKRRLFKIMDEELLQVAPSRLHIHVVSFDDIANMDRLELMWPAALLKMWGFNPDREITFFDDRVEKCRVFKQEVFDAVE